MEFPLVDVTCALVHCVHFPIATSMICGRSVGRGCKLPERGSRQMTHSSSWALVDAAGGAVLSSSLLFMVTFLYDDDVVGRKC